MRCATTRIRSPRRIRASRRASISGRRSRSSGRYFNPDDSLGPGGFTYVEVYDPGYWMARNALLVAALFPSASTACEAKSENSALNDCAVALWVTKYEHVVPEVSAGTGVRGGELSLRISAVVLQAERRRQHRRGRVRRMGHPEAAMSASIENNVLSRARRRRRRDRGLRRGFADGAPERGTVHGDFRGWSSSWTRGAAFRSSRRTIPFSCSTWRGRSPEIPPGTIIVGTDGGGYIRRVRSVQRRRETALRPRDARVSGGRGASSDSSTRRSSIGFSNAERRSAGRRMR